jgi:hypothetical protein
MHDHGATPETVAPQKLPGAAGVRFILLKRYDNRVVEADLVEALGYDQSADSRAELDHASRLRESDLASEQLDASGA